ncbi:recombinase family protein [Streptomyces olivoreticuli]
MIDEDLGHSASGLVDRQGFQRLVSEVGLDHVGLVLGVEMSRLARSGREWHQLLELCALAGALLADLDGVYDPAEHNDRLVRHEVLCDRVEVKDHHRRAVAAAR